MAHVFTNPSKSIDSPGRRIIFALKSSFLAAEDASDFVAEGQAGGFIAQHRLLDVQNAVFDFAVNISSYDGVTGVSLAAIPRRMHRISSDLRS